VCHYQALMANTISEISIYVVSTNYRCFGKTQGHSVDCAENQTLVKLKQQKWFGFTIE